MLINKGSSFNIVKNYVTINEPRNHLADFNPFNDKVMINRPEDFVPANCNEQAFFRLVVPNYDAKKWQLTGARVHIAKVWDVAQRRLIEVEDKTGVGTALDCIASDEGVPKARSWEGQEALQKLFYYPELFRGVFVRLDSEEVAGRLRQFDFGFPYEGVDEDDRIRVWYEDKTRHYGENCMFLPAFNIFDYQVPTHLASRKFTPRLDGDWPPTKAFIEFIDGFHPREPPIERMARTSDLLTVTTIVKTVPCNVASRDVREIERRYRRSLEYRAMSDGTAALVYEKRFPKPD